MLIFVPEKNSGLVYMLRRDDLAPGRVFNAAPSPISSAVS